MPDGPQRYYLNDLLNLLTNPVYRRLQQNQVFTPNGYRVVGELVDQTGIGGQNETDNRMAVIEYILDCGHAAKNGLGGICHYCDSIVCRNCITLCSSCGHSVCPQDSLIANFDGQIRPYCRSCAEEISRRLRLRAVGRTILAVFVPSNRK